MLPSDEDLYRYMVHSNRIELKGDRFQDTPVYSDHLDVLYEVRINAEKKEWPNITALHSLLCRDSQAREPNVRREEVGCYRTCGVRVGGHSCPKWVKVPRLMHAWVVNCHKFLDRAHDETPAARTALTWALYCWFESIHPFIDGNGRLGRALLAYFQMRAGVPLDYDPIAEDEHNGISSVDRDKHYDRIRRWRSRRHWHKVEWESLSSSRVTSWSGK